MAKLTKEKVEAVLKLIQDGIVDGREFRVSDDLQRPPHNLRRYTSPLYLSAVEIVGVYTKILAAMDVVEAERVSPYRRTMKVAQALKRYNELSGGTPLEEDKDNANVSTPGSGEAGTDRTD